MKKIFCIVVLLFQTNCFAQTGEGTVQSTMAASDNRWQNWIFAAGALIVAGGGMFAVSINNGKSPTTTTTAH